jgi:hypothetical protein
MPVSVTYNEINSIIKEVVQPQLRDNFFANSDPLIRMLETRSKPAEGLDIRVPVQHSRSQGAARWGGGANTFDVNIPESITKAVFPVAKYISAFGLPETDKVQNMGAGKVLDLLKVQMNLIENSMIHIMNTDAYLTGATTETASGQAGLQGLSQALTYGSDANSAYGGISRSGASGTFTSPTANAFWNANSVAANANTTKAFFYYPATFDNLTVITLDKMEQLYGSVCIGQEQPTDIIMGRALYNKYFALFTAIQRQMSSDKVGKVGASALEFNFTPVYPSAFIDAATKIYMLNKNTWNLFAYPAMDFEFSGLLPVPNARVQTGSFAWMGQMVCDRPNLNAVMTAATAA